MDASNEHETGDLWVFGYGSLMWRPGFDVLERVPARLRVELRPKPLLTPLQDVRALPFLGMRGFFLNVTSCRSKKRQITDEEKRSPQLAISRSWISNNVMSG
jgi:hypothetical protein